MRDDAIVKGRRGVSADSALLLEAPTGWNAQIWLTLQSSRRELAPVQHLIERTGAASRAGLR